LARHRLDPDWWESGVVIREVARRTVGANRLLGADLSPYLPREARRLAERDGYGDGIEQPFNNHSRSRWAGLDGTPCRDHRRPRLAPEGNSLGNI
jgi:hypothetical protein